MKEKIILFLLAFVLGVAACYFFTKSKEDGKVAVLKYKMQESEEKIKKLLADSIEYNKYIRSLENKIEFSISDTVKTHETIIKNISAITALPADSQISLLAKHLSQTDHR